MKKIVLGVQVVGLGAQLVGLASPYWMDAGKGLHLGLWHFCGPIYSGNATPGKIVFPMSEESVKNATGINIGHVSQSARNVTSA